MEEPVRIQGQHVVGIPKHRLPKRPIKELNVPEAELGDGRGGGTCRCLSAHIRKREREH
jgi:arginine deiminase